MILCFIRVGREGLSVLSEMYPEAPIYTLLYDGENVKSGEAKMYVHHIAEIS